MFSQVLNHSQAFLFIKNMHEIPMKLEKFNCFFKPCAPKHLHAKNRSYMTGKLSFCSCPVKFSNRNFPKPSFSVPAFVFFGCFDDIIYSIYFGYGKNFFIYKQFKYSTILVKCSKIKVETHESNCV
jgi:hypothetical protein